MKKVILFIIGIVGYIYSQVDTTGVVIDPSFEHRYKYWKMGDSRFTISNDDSYGGRFSLRVSTNRVSWKSCSQVIRVEPSVEYTVLIWLRGTARVGVAIYTREWGYIENQVFTPTGIWNMYMFKFYSGKNTTLNFCIQDQGVGISYIDEISIIR